jgi:hypothetical protein
MGARAAVSGVGGQQFVDQLVDGDQLGRPHVQGTAAVLVSPEIKGALRAPPAPAPPLPLRYRRAGPAHTLGRPQTD